MVPSPTPTTFILLILGVSAFILIMLLPAFLELKRPRDTGPRVIMDNVSALQQRAKDTFMIANIEEEQRFDQALIKKIADVIASLPSLDA